MPASLDLYFCEIHNYKWNEKKIHSTSSQLEAHSRLPCYSEQTCPTRFASHLHSFKLLDGVESNYTGYLLGLAIIFQVVLGIGIFFGLVQCKKASGKLNETLLNLFFITPCDYWNLLGYCLVTPAILRLIIMRTCLRSTL